jgi:hypothetical protein
MIHYTCDRCRRLIEAEEEVRYVVRLEIQAAMDPLCTEEGEEPADRDHLMEINDILERMEDAESELVGEDVYQKRRFDLCPECYRKFAKNPLGQETAASLGFSQN